MRREQSRYIFAPDRRYREGRHGFRRTVLVLIPLLLLLFFVSNFIISHQVKLEKLPLLILNLPSDLEGYSILHISDLHGQQYGAHQRAMESILKGNRYSCVVMTGDMMGSDHDLTALLDMVALMPKDTPKYFIPGDTEGSWLDSFAHGNLSVYTDWAETMREAGITLLELPVSETRGKGKIWFVPEELYTLNLENMEQVYLNQLKDLNARVTTLSADGAANRRVAEHELERIRTLREMRKEFQATDIQVVLTHTPLSEDYVAETYSWSGKEDYFSMRYASLILAGHYNGGQWRIPWIGPIHVPELGWFPKDEQVRGLSYPQGIPQYISPGLGSAPHYTWQPGRLFNPPVMTLITLTGKGI